METPVKDKQQAPLDVAELQPMYYALNPPKLVGFDVRVNGKTIAVLRPEDVLKAAELTAHKPPQ